MPFERIVKQLKENAAMNDQSVFNKWRDGSIATETAISMFKKNNKIKDDIHNLEFVLWLNSLGYVREG